MFEAELVSLAEKLGSNTYICSNDKLTNITLLLLNPLSPDKIITLTEQLQLLRRQDKNSPNPSLLARSEFYMVIASILKHHKSTLRSKRSHLESLKYNLGFRHAHEIVLHNSAEDFNRDAESLAGKLKTLWNPQTWVFIMLRAFDIPYKSFLFPNVSKREHKLNRAILNLASKEQRNNRAIEENSFTLEIQELIEDIKTHNDTHSPLLLLDFCTEALDSALEIAKSIEKMRALENHDTESTSIELRRKQRLADVVHGISEKINNSTNKSIVIPTSLETAQGRKCALVVFTHNSTQDTFDIDLYDNDGPVTKCLNKEFTILSPHNLVYSGTPRHKLHNVPKVIAKNPDFIRAFVEPAVTKYNNFDNAAHILAQPFLDYPKYHTIGSGLTKELDNCCNHSLISTWLLSESISTPTNNEIMLLFIADQKSKSTQQVIETANKNTRSANKVLKAIKTLIPNDTSEITTKDTKSKIDDLVLSGKGQYDYVHHILETKASSTQKILANLRQKRSDLNQKIGAVIPEVIQELRTQLKDSIENARVEYAINSGQNSKKAEQVLMGIPGAPAPITLQPPSLFSSSKSSRKAYNVYKKQTQTLKKFEKLIAEAGKNTHVLTQILKNFLDKNTQIATLGWLKVQLENYSDEFDVLLSGLSGTEFEIHRNEHLMKCISARAA